MADRLKMALIGTAAEPFLKSWNAVRGLTLVPKAAVVPLASPLPLQSIASTAWHAAASKSRSAWQPGVHTPPVFAAQL